MLDLLNHPLDTDSLEVDVLRRLSFYYTNDVSGDSALIYLNRMKEVSDDGSYRYGFLLYEFWLGYYHFRRANYKAATNHLLRSAAYGQKLNRPKQEAEAYSRASLIFDIQGMTDSARYYLEKGINISSQLNDLNVIALSYTTLGNLESRAGNHLKALQHFITVDSICNASEKDMAYRQGLALQNIAMIYFEKIKNYDQALYYMRKSREAYERKKDNAEQLDAADFVFGRIYFEMGEYAKSDSLMQSALKGYRARGHMRKVAEINMEYGLLKEKALKFSEAEKLLKEAEKIYLDSKDKAGSANSAAQLGRFYANQRKYDRAIINYEKALKYEIGIGQRSDLLKNLSQSYREAGPLTAAYDTLMAHLVLADSQGAHQLSADLQELEMKYQTSQKENEIVDLKLSQNKQAAKTQRFIYGSVSILSLLSGLSFMFYYRARQRKRTNARLKELDELKSRLFADISHELRTPISLIKGPVDIILKNETMTDSVRQQLQMVNRNANRLNLLANSVNNLIQLDEAKLSLSIKKVDFATHLKIIAASFESMAVAKGLTFTLDPDSANIPAYYDPECIETIVFNLLSNAFKFTNEGHVKVHAHHKDDWITIAVADSGIGISGEDQGKIFKRYFRIEKKGYSSEGIGIGLALAFRLAELHKGELTVSSTIGEGSTFTLLFPINKAFYEKQGLTIHETHIPKSKGLVGTKKKVPTSVFPVIADEPLILLVEDNPDMRTYLDQLFETEYRILTAEDGKQGAEVARKYIPDLIISDLMMPVMDGQELLKEMKGDTKTSHIPFVMLTANHTEAEKLKGLKTGADDYLTKPFSLDELKARVENLIKSRELIRAKYQEQSIIDPALLSNNEVDRQFWSDLQNVLRLNLSNADFSNTDFAHALHMSRMQLHRKLKALTGLSTNTYLRTERLKAGYLLLQSRKYNVSEVAYEVGFSSPFYFSKCFKEIYGMSPSSILEV